MTFFFFAFLFTFLPGVSISSDVLSQIQRRCSGLQGPCYDLPPPPSLLPCGEGQVLHSKNAIIRSAAQCQISEAVNSISSPPPVVR